MRKAFRLVTTNKDLYNKFNMLNFSTEVLIKSEKCLRLNKIVGNINKGGESVLCERVGDYFLVRKKNPIKFDVYLKK